MLAEGPRLWFAAGAACVGAVLGGLAVWAAVMGAPRQVPAPEGRRGNAPASLDVLPVATAPTLAKLGPRDDQQLIDAVAATRDTVVNIKVGDQLVGAGVVFDPEGYVFTNYHVVASAFGESFKFPGQGAAQVRVTVRFHDGRERGAVVLAADRDEDIAVLRVEPSSESERFLAAAIGESARLRVGESVFAVGCPLGLEHTVSTGIVSALGRTDVLANRQLPLIQLDASINLGSSGGPVFNLRGELVGITTARLAGAEGIGFAIPIDRVRAFLNALAQGENESAGVIGVLLDPQKPIEPGLAGTDYRAGVVVSEVPDGPARTAGVRPGDIIVAVRGKRYDEFGGDREGRIRFSWVFGKVVRSLLPGEELSFTVVRRGEVLELSLAVEAADARRQAHVDSAEMLGLVLAEDTDIPIVVAIEPGTRVAEMHDASALLRCRISQVLDQRVRTIDELGVQLKRLKPWRRIGQAHDVAVGFECRGASMIVVGFPLTVER